MYGEYGSGGKAFWEKAGFPVIGSHRQETPTDETWRRIVETQAAEKGLSLDKAWTRYRMAYTI